MTSMTLELNRSIHTKHLGKFLRELGRLVSLAELGDLERICADVSTGWARCPVNCDESEVRILLGPRNTKALALVASFIAPSFVDAAKMLLRSQSRQDDESVDRHALAETASHAAVADGLLAGVS